MFYSLRFVKTTSNIFDQYAAILETVIDRGIFTTKSHVLYRIMPLSMTFSDPEPHFQGHSSVFKGEYLANGNIRSTHVWWF